MQKRTEWPPDSSPAPRSAAWDRPLAVTSALIFLLSLVFPVGVALTKDTSVLPKWWGTLDVILAAILAALAIAVVVLARGKVTREVEDVSYRVYRQLIHVIFGLLLAFQLFPDRIVLVQSLPVHGWRAWLLLYALPKWLALWGGAEPMGRSSKIRVRALD